MVSTFSKTILFVLVLVFFSCKDTKENDKIGTEALEDTSKKTVLTASTDLEIYDFSGLEPLLHKKDDKTYIINFWATWCAPCIAELPYFERINKERKNDNVEVILVSLDMPKMWDSHLIPFVKKKDLKSKVVVLDDPKQNKWIPKVDEDWSGAIPATLIYNKDERYFYEKSFTYEELVAQLEKFKK